MRRHTGRWLVVGFVALAVALADTGTATLVITTRPGDVQVLVDGQDKGRTPATLLLDLPGGKPREVKIELRRAGFETRTATLVLGPGETVVWSGIALGVLDDQPLRPSDLDRPAPPTKQLPANWPAYLRGYVVPAGAQVRVVEPDAMPQVLLPATHVTIGSNPDQIERAIQMSSLTGKPDEASLKAEGPLHQVALAAHWLDLHPVTNEQFCRFLNAVKPTAEQRTAWITLAGESKEAFAPQIQAGGPGFQPVPKFDLYPVRFVSFRGAEAYAKWAGRRLPTEAEYERAARGGADGLFFAWPGNTPPPNSANLCDLTHVQRFPSIKKPGRYFVGYDDGYEAASPVASFSPNALGLFDIVGNVWEWCADAYDPAYYAKSPAKDPLNTAAGEYGRVLRGGSFLNAPWAVRPARRLFSAETVKGVVYGFRLAATP